MFSKMLILPMATAMLTAMILPASADAIADRQAKMKTMGKNIGVVAKMAKGQADFDATAALAAFVAMRDAADGYEELFPEGSETGGETEASPKIWSDREGFNKAQADFEADLATATQAAPADLAALQATLGMVGENCGICHKAYRIKKD